MSDEGKDFDQQILVVAPVENSEPPSPASIKVTCRCGIVCWVSATGQAMLKAHPELQPTCFYCARKLIRENPEDQHEVQFISEATLDKVRVYARSHGLPEPTRAQLEALAKSVLGISKPRDVTKN